jgi:hypothetical protein
MTKTEVEFVGKGLMDGKKVEIHFKTSNIEVSHERMSAPTLTIHPSFDKEKKTYFTMNVMDESKEKGEVEMENLKIKATLAYLGWLKGDDVVSPMNELKRELERQGVDIKVISQVYDQLRR